MRRVAFLFFACALVLTMSTTRRAEGHATLTSSVALDVSPDGVEAEVDLPLDQLGLALGETFTRGAVDLPRRDARLRLYIADHLQLADATDRPYSTVVRDLALTSIDGGDYLVARIDFLPPSGAQTSALTLHDELILHRVVTHHILVSLRRDFAQALFGKEPKILGVLTYSQKEITLSREEASVGRGARALIAMGAAHIAEGTDHLLFLFVLLLPASLVASRKRWGHARPVSETVRALLLVVTAFTLGHSIALALATFRIIVVPSKPVEIAIAVSIALSAIHAFRPIFARREPLVAAAFGLVHGLAFATALEELGLRGSSLAVSLVSFNVGIEAMQLAVVVAVVPWLVLLSRTPIYAGIRVFGAALSAIAAGGWLMERVSGHGNAITRVIPILERHAIAGTVSLALFAIVAALVTRLRRWARSPAISGRSASPSILT